MLDWAASNPRCTIHISPLITPLVLVGMFNHLITPLACQKITLTRSLRASQRACMSSHRSVVIQLISKVASEWLGIACNAKHAAHTRLNTINQNPRKSTLKSLNLKMRMDTLTPAACGTCFQCRRTFEGRSASFNWCALPSLFSNHIFICFITYGQAIEGSDGSDVFHLLPKFHPELNPLEYLWGWSKRYFQEHSNRNLGFAKSLVPTSLDVCPLVTIRCFFRRSEHYISVYSLGATGLSAEYAVKKYKSHRGVSQWDLDAAEEEHMAKATALQWLS